MSRVVLVKKISCITYTTSKEKDKKWSGAETLVTILWCGCKCANQCIIIYFRYWAEISGIYEAAVAAFLHENLQETVAVCTTQYSEIAVSAAVEVR